jgi:hypothetical protein
MPNTQEVFSTAAFAIPLKLEASHLVDDTPGGPGLGTLPPDLRRQVKRNPTIVTLWHLAQALEVKLRQLFDEDKPRRR